MIKIVEIDSVTGSEETLGVSAYFRSNDVGSPHFVSLTQPYRIGENYRHVLIRNGEEIEIEISCEAGDTQNPYSFVATDRAGHVSLPFLQPQERPEQPRLSAKAG